MVTDKKAPLENLELMLPGFRFYKIMDMIKQDDALVRYALKDNLEKLREKIERNEKDIVLRTPYDSIIQDYESTLSILRAFIQEVIASPTGIYTIYSRYKIETQDIENVLSYDYFLLKESKELIENFNKFSILDIKEKIGELREKYQLREKYFKPDRIK
ncbi:MAG: hypothetical protein ACP5LM_02780 [Thermoplasmata archaeon]